MTWKNQFHLPLLDSLSLVFIFILQGVKQKQTPESITLMQFTLQTTKKDEVIDITDVIEELLGTQEKQEGVCTIFVQHTTCCITTADLDPGTDLDFLDAIRGMLPKMQYRHPHDPSHTPDHILSSIIGPSVSIPFSKKQLALGVWQRVVLVELDGPRQRAVTITVS